MRKPESPNRSDLASATSFTVQPTKPGSPGAASTRTAAPGRSPSQSRSGVAAGAVTVEVMSPQDVKVALVLEGVLPVEAVFPAPKGLPPLPRIDDLELSTDLPVVASTDEPARYAGGRYDLPPAIEVEPGVWTAEVKFGANGRWIRRLQVEGLTQADAEATARRVLETAVTNLVSLEDAHAAVSGKAPSA